MNGTMSAPVGAALRSSFTVLVSDDDPAVRRSLHMMLCAYGYDVQSYTSGQALLADPCAAAADCLVIDYSMPDVDGASRRFDVTRRGVRYKQLVVDHPVLRGACDVTLSIDTTWRCR